MLSLKIVDLRMSRWSWHGLGYLFIAHLIILSSLYELEAVVVIEVSLIQLHSDSGVLEEGSCVFPYTVQEHRRNILDRSQAVCFPDNTLTWAHTVHSHIKVPNVIQHHAN